ncbi:MAG: hypothetical protein E7639_04375 [Ruminococcaceae bacterium]|nr:hypothetical protein [Oscillospiraceae bacterium]
MKKKIELPLVEPLYSTYPCQGAGTAVLINNPSIRNWYLNQVMILTCMRKFLNGFTTPEIGVVESSWVANPYLDKKWHNMQFMEGHTHFVIRKLLDEGYYVYFTGIDDYYVEGKSWYHERHFDHDGCICGYDQENKTYCIYSYDQNWIYQKFWTTQKSFDAGRKALFKKKRYGNICGIKPKGEQIAFSHETALKKIAEYLDSNLEKYPETEEGAVYGIVVHDYIAKYVGKLYDGSIPYEKMDRRVFRMIWEHKKVMLERVKLIEDALSLDHSLSDAYTSVVREADNCRMLYAAHHMKQRNSVLPIIQKKLMSLKEKEKKLLENLLEATKG